MAPGRVRSLCGLSSPLGAVSLVVILVAGWIARCAAAVARDRGGGGRGSDRRVDPHVPRRGLVPVHRRQPPAVDGRVVGCRLVWPIGAARSMGGGHLRRRYPRCVRGRVAVGRERGAAWLAPRRSCGCADTRSPSHDGPGDRRCRSDLERRVHLDGVQAGGSNRVCSLLRLAGVVPRHRPATVPDRSSADAHVRTPTRWRCGSAALPVVGKPSSIAS